MKGAAALHERLAYAHDDRGEPVVDLPVCGAACVADAAVPEGRARRSSARLHAKPQALPDALRGFRSLLLGDHAFDGGHQVAVTVELHERAIGVAPHLDAGVLELTSSAACRAASRASQSKSRKTTTSKARRSAARSIA